MGTSTSLARIDSANNDIELGGIKQLTPEISASDAEASDSPHHIRHIGAADIEVLLRILRRDS